MGLRESLRDLFTVQDATAGFAKAGQAYGQQQQQMQATQDLRTLAQQIPGAIESGDYSAVAGDAYALGDNSILKGVMAQQSALAKAKNQPQDTPLTMEQLQQMYPTFSPEQLAAVATAPSRTNQRQELSVLSTYEGRNAQQQLVREAEGRREQDAQISAEDAFTKNLRTELRKERDELQQLDKLAALDINDRSSFWMAATNMIKTIGREAGALTDNDIGRPFPMTGVRTVKDMLTWLGARDANKNNIDPEILQSVQDILKIARRKAEEIHSKKAQKVIQAEAISKRDRLMPNGQLSPVIENAAQEYGLVAGFDDKGKFVVGKEIPGRKQKLDFDTAGASADAVAVAKSLPPDMQARALQMIKKYSDAGKPVPPEMIEKMRQMGAK